MRYEWRDFVPVIGLGRYMDRKGLSRLESEDDYNLAYAHCAMILGSVFVEPAIKIVYSGVVSGLEHLLK